MKRILFYILLWFPIVCFSQTPNYLDSILSLETKVSSDSFLKIVLEIEYDKALINSKKYLELSKKAERIALNLGDQKLIADSYKALSLAYHFSSKFDVSFDYTLKSAKIYQELNDMVNYASSYTDLGWKIKNRDLQKGLFYMQKGIKILEKEKISSWHLIGAYNNFGVLQQMSAKLDSAYYYHKKSLDLAITHNDSIGIPFAQTHIAEVYMKKKKFALANQYFNDALTIRQKRNDTYGIADSQLYLGDLYFVQGNFKKAIQYYTKGEEFATKHHYFPLRKYALEFLYKSYDSISDLKKAFFYYKTFNKLKDSILNKNTNTRIAELEIQFQTLEKEKEIAKQKEKLLENELTLKTRNLYTLLLSAAFIILGIVSLGVYRRNQYKRKQLVKELALKDALATIKTQNRLQEQRLKISRDLHDNIGSQLTFIISSIDNLKYASKDFNTTFKEKLSTISTFTSDTIFQLRDTIWAMNKGEVSYKDFHSRIIAFIEKAKVATSTIDFKIENSVQSAFSFESIISINLFRVVQEIINNSMKHSNASMVRINTNEKEHFLNIEINDNGVGFNIKEVALGNGLRNIKKRMKEINGTVSIESESGKGTKIVLMLPMKNTTNDV
ncbi:MAG: tetratricopeptide repeat protein [Flavobacteriaceae bacterium]